MKAENWYTDSLWDDKVEPETNKEVRSARPAETEDKDGVGHLLEELVSSYNLEEAYWKVRSNGGALGIDGMTVEDAEPYLEGHREEIVTQILKGKYKPKPVRRVEIPKPDGGVRLLGRLIVGF